MRNILIVEDDPFTQEFYRFLFQKTEYNILQTEDGDEVLKILENDQFVLIILDISLKNTYLKGEKIDGIALSRIIKKKKKYSDIPILLVTAYNTKVGSRDFFEESLADDYIIKPITDFNYLIDKVRKMVPS